MKAVIDTMVVRKANATLSHSPKKNRTITTRLALLKRIAAGEIVPLYSSKLIAEYSSQILEPRNEFVRAFLEQLTNTGVPNWRSPWTGERADARKCRFPVEDDHVLRTAILEELERSHVVTEEKRQLDAASCVKRKFNVDILTP